MMEPNYSSSSTKCDTDPYRLWNRTKFAIDIAQVEFYKWCHVANALRLASRRSQERKDIARATFGPQGMLLTTNEIQSGAIHYFLLGEWGPTTGLDQRQFLGHLIRIIGEGVNFTAADVD